MMDRAMPARATTFRFTFWKLVFLFLMAAGLYATFVRFTRGLGASTHLSDQFPWASGSASMFCAASCWLPVDSL